jgi:hypothetical protein
MSYLHTLGESLVLGDLLGKLVKRFGAFELVTHWTQGEFHHDVVLRLSGERGDAPPILVVSTNCNGGVKELLAFDVLPSRAALWNYRLGDASAASIGLRESVRTLHWFDPRELLGENARSELKPEYRARQSGGGWKLRDDRVCGTDRSG